jgi:hypothetical protein
MNLKNAYKQWREIERCRAALREANRSGPGRNGIAIACTSPGLAVLARIAGQRSSASRWSW